MTLEHTEQTAQILITPEEVAGLLFKKSEILINLEGRVFKVVAGEEILGSRVVFSVASHLIAEIDGELREAETSRSIGQTPRDAFQGLEEKYRMGIYKALHAERKRY